MSAQPFEARIAHLEGAFEQIVERLGGIDRRLEAFERRVDQRFGTIDQRFNWLIGIVIGTWITTILAILFRH